jgi:hypothetical protein
MAISAVTVPSLGRPERQKHKRSSHPTDKGGGLVDVSSGIIYGIIYGIILPYG